MELSILKSGVLPRNTPLNMKSVPETKYLRQKRQKPILLMGFLGDALRFIKIKTSVSSANLAVLRINNFYNNSKAKNELNMDFTPIDGAIGEAIRCFKGK